jgi:FMN phosphatase YigB (HAD superfamily)
MVYIDDMYKYPMGKFGRMKMSHMIADSTKELLSMAEGIGLKKEWIQYEGTPLEHFDISITKRKEALKLGAVEISLREMGKRISERKQQTTAL